MVVRSWRVDIVQELRYCVESHAIAYPRMHPAKIQRGFHAPTCHKAPWHLRYTPIFNPKPSWNSPCPPTTLSSQNMPRTWYQTCQKHDIKPSYNQYQNHTHSILFVHVTIFLSFVHLFIHVFIYSYHYSFTYSPFIYSYRII